ncbi:Dihaem cytochrome c [Tistlia consotensis]|uniref:Dihaem cytochrome c n=1 Tax=Tistlia consotensis USBA 355 TaxID=560819 RepID=A0A1Y6BIS9_9PROT|nr:diheme cytochrome c [Tistlia consotensis]SMF13635.1 Dihaem cytochrome c [Tistlia consotensis USBA 355]SNR50319.1 Dihaem cytochrome c [Tistlia consotensis]
MPSSRNRARLLAAALAVSVSALAIGLLAGPRAEAEEEGMSIPPVADATVQAECSACHMAFPAALLPARSWRALMAGLDDHFGENAGLDPATTAKITDYLVANAADAGGHRSPVLRGLGPDDVPLRISETPWWERQHRGEVSPSAFKDPRVGSKANCVACHRDAARGFFGDD